MRAVLSKPHVSATLGLILLCCVSCRKETPEPETAPNVLLILIDTLRVDRLGCYGSTLGLTPNIDRLADQGVLFQQAFSHAPWTLPSVSSLLTSTYPARHRAGGRLDGPRGLKGLSPTVRTLPECFRNQGYATAAIVNVLFLSPRFGVERGFDHYDFQPPKQNQEVQRVATEVTDLGLAWIKKHQQESKKPFFFLVHYFDPHLTYDPPAKFRKRYAMPIDRERDSHLFGTVEDMIKLRKGQIALDLLPMNRLKRLYNGEIAYTDEQVGRLLRGLHDMGLDESTIVVLTADHGEEHMDHGGFEHGHTLYDELIHIPLILRYPGVLRPAKIHATVRHIDVAPTLCHLTNIKPADTFQGNSLEPLIWGETTKNRLVLSQGNMWGPPQFSLRLKGYKLIKKPDGLELYHVADDPREQRDLAGRIGYRRLTANMTHDLALVLKEVRMKHRKDGKSVTLSEAEKKQLAALGYVSFEGGHDTGDDLLENPSTPTSRPASDEASKNDKNRR